ncbi:hypothetical protein Amet_0798 [Alkaliphilus metalliredigens QYMF]|uniref:SurA domain n=1 Tax=Alkaliphilus metalliredigens (strain QYMF) TaxID=293826 RepID=A6TLF5_ALKMQ|nr:SurA N-terminal domain-containing protein [Alkaliphilus metalliredigens]ABR47023.1 hypothetical protein Amet_0798 [Alkaliphilus metalliredigens QYMF]
MFTKKSLLFIVVGLIALLVIGCASEGENLSQDQGEVVATVNGASITREVFENTVERTKLNYQQQGIEFEGEEGEAMLVQVREQALNSLLQEEVLLQEAKEKGYDVSEEAIETELESMKGQFESEEEFEAALEFNQFTEDDLRNMLASEMAIEQFLQNELEEAPASDEEAQELYDQYAAQMKEIAEETGETEEMPAFEEVKEQLKMQIAQENQQELMAQLIDGLMEQSEIEIFL